jgi:hypothetical protein
MMGHESLIGRYHMAASLKRCRDQITGNPFGTPNEFHHHIDIIGGGKCHWIIDPGDAGKV